MAFNASVRADDEWFDDPDELERVERMLDGLSNQKDPVVAAAKALSKIARAQAFSEGDKRTALLVGLWILDRNGIDERQFIPEDDRELGALLVRAARGEDVAEEVARLFEARR